VLLRVKRLQQQPLPFRLVQTVDSAQGHGAIEYINCHSTIVTTVILILATDPGKVVIVDFCLAEPILDDKRIGTNKLRELSI
jgi:hypothetical protein